MYGSMFKDPLLILVVGFLNLTRLATDNKGHCHGTLASPQTLRVGNVVCPNAALNRERLVDDHILHLDRHHRTQVADLVLVRIIVTWETTAWIVLEGADSMRRGARHPHLLALFHWQRGDVLL